MTFFTSPDMSRSEVDAHIRAMQSPSHQPIPEVGPQVDLPPTPAEEAAYAARQAARAAHATPPAPRSVRAVRWVRRVVLERQHGRGASGEGAGAGAV